jgi:hypothetical protein
VATTTTCIQILLLEEDWRTRRFIGTVLKYATDAVVIEASCAKTVVSAERPIDLLIAGIESENAAAGIEEVREIAAGNPSMRVLLMSFCDRLPCEIPAGWRFLSIPFPTSDFVDCVTELGVR